MRRLLGARESFFHVKEYQDDDTYVIRAELPGDVEISVSPVCRTRTADGR